MLFVWSLITICSALLLIQIQIVEFNCDTFWTFRQFQIRPIVSLLIQLHHEDNFAVILITMVEVFYGFGVMFVACELSQRVNLAFDECNDMITQFEWYLFPAEIQRMLPLTMKYTQQSVEINCFGSTACNRETFKYVSVTNAISFLGR